MRKALASLVAVVVLPSLAAAGEVEITGFGGYTFPFYHQEFRYDPGPVNVPIPGVSIQQNGAFELAASGGTSFGGSVALFPADAFGFELRIESADLTVETESPTYDVHATLPAPLAPVNATLSLTASQADLSAATPFSLNLKFRTAGSTRVFVSGGISYLRDLGFTLQQTVALGVTVVNLQTSNLDVGTIGMRARRLPGDPRKNWGGNLGLGFTIPLGERGGLTLEGRGFYFQKQTYEWQPVIETPLGPFEQLLLDRVQGRLEPVEFHPWWVQATIGFSYRF